MAKYNTLSYLTALLKAYGIKNIVANPGTQNSQFNAIVQKTDYFNCYSVLDERSAAYTAVGIAQETGEPVVITCTGATASRNYLSALTEAYYRKIPIIAITFYPDYSNKYSVEPQYIDRSISQNDVKTIDVDLPIIRTNEDKEECIILIQEALFTAKYRNEPVHINCHINLNFDEDYLSLPEVLPVECHKENFEILQDNMQNQDFAIFIGAHRKFSAEEHNAISVFAKSWDLPVICDHTSNYFGDNKVLLSRYCAMQRVRRHPQYIIDMGLVSGNYFQGFLFRPNIKIWRISEDMALHFRNNRHVERILFGQEKAIFKALTRKEKITDGYYTYIKSEMNKLKNPDLPLSNTLICENLAKYLPENCTLHASIINSLRSINFYETEKKVEISCNVGGFGIDGAVSTLVGQSLAAPDKLHFGLIGDLAFFYDMNILGNRHITNNIRILLVNNNKGVEFRFNPILEKHLGNETDVLISAGNHYKNGAKDWALSCGFEYMHADNKESFLKQIQGFCNNKFEKPVLFEVYTKTEDEQESYNLIQQYNRNKLEDAAIKIYHAFKI
ncbi:MAG: thiamine pyrophosphate-binding protein [Candidatus Avigastranaerophilus sp.]